MNQWPRNDIITFDRYIWCFCSIFFYEIRPCSVRIRCCIFAAPCTPVLVHGVIPEIHWNHISTEISSVLTFLVLYSSSFSCRHFSSLSLWMSLLCGIASSITTTVLCTLSIIYFCVQFRSVCTVTFAVVHLQFQAETGGFFWWCLHAGWLSL